MDALSLRVQREYAAEARCRVCGEVIYSEIHIELDGRTTRIVQGHYRQQLLPDGSVGPVLPFCPDHSQEIITCP